jgi:hypothetical protein
MPNGDDQRASILRDMAGIVQRLEDGAKTLELRLKEIELTHIEKDAFRETVDELRKYTDSKTEAGIKRGEKSLDDKIGLARSGIMHDLERLIKSEFDEFKENQIVPLFDQLAADREERKQVERDKQVQQWRNRIALGTAVLLFMVSFYQTFRPKPDNARDYTRPIERLSDIAQ